MNASLPPVSVEKLCCAFGRREVLRDISFDVEPGSIVALVGPNGSGKTTLISCICGLARPSSGRITIFGVEGTRAGPAIKRRMGVLTQETALYGDLSVRQNLRFVADLFGVSADRIPAVLQLVGLADQERMRAGNLSGAMCPRVAVARMLLHEPDLLILDEPTVAIDAHSRHAIWEHIRRLSAAGKTMPPTTNHLDEAEALADRIILFQEGLVVADMTPRNCSAGSATTAWRSRLTNARCRD